MQVQRQGKGILYLC